MTDSCNLGKYGSNSPTCIVGAKKIRGCSILDVPPFFESSGREELVDPVNRIRTGEGSTPKQEEGNSAIFRGDNQGPVVMVWDRMLSGEQESAKRSSTDLRERLTLQTRSGRLGYHLNLSSVVVCHKDS